MILYIDNCFLEYLKYQKMDYKLTVDKEQLAEYIVKEFDDLAMLVQSGRNFKKYISYLTPTGYKDAPRHCQS